MTLTPEQLAELKRIEAKALAPGRVPYSDTITVLCALPALISAAEREARMREALTLARSVLSGDQMSKAALVEALEAIRAALAGDA